MAPYTLQRHVYILRRISLFDERKTSGGDIIVFQEGRYFCSICWSEIDAEEHAEFGGHCEDCDEVEELHAEERVFRGTMMC